MRQTLSTIALFTLCAPLTGCVIGGDKYPRPAELTPVWLVDRPRILAVKATPPEPQPGELVRFDSLIVDPFTEIGSVAWVACVSPDDGGTGFGCIENTDQVIGFQPGLEPAYTPPQDVLADLPEEDRAEGRYVLVTVTALPPGDIEDLENVDFSEVETGYKRIVVSEAQTPNHNPEITGFAIDGLRIPDGTIIEVDAGQAYDLGPFLSPESIEGYVYVNSDGVAEDRVESPYFSFYATDGTVQEEVTLYDFPESTWVAPTESGVTGHIYVVVRDRRGGMDWHRQPFIVR